MTALSYVTESHDRVTFEQWNCSTEHYNCIVKMQTYRHISTRHKLFVPVFSNPYIISQHCCFCLCVYAYVCAHMCLGMRMFLHVCVYVFAYCVLLCDFDVVDCTCQSEVWGRGVILSLCGCYCLVRLCASESRTFPSCGAVEVSSCVKCGTFARFLIDSGGIKTTLIGFGSLIVLSLIKRSRESVICAHISINLKF